MTVYIDDSMIYIAIINHSYEENTMKIEDVEVGSEIYLVHGETAAFHRKKIKKVDENGVEWFRYDRELWTAELKKFVVVAKIEVDVKTTLSLSPAEYAQLNTIKSELTEQNENIVIRDERGFLMGTYADEFYGTLEEANAEIATILARNDN